MEVRERHLSRQPPHDGHLLNDFGLHHERSRDAVIKNPGLNSASQPVATIGIGSSGLLVEDNGNVASGINSDQYENVLGAGTGAVGWPKLSSALDVSSLSGTQYLGFARGAGV